MILASTQHIFVVRVGASSGCSKASTNTAYDSPFVEDHCPNCVRRLPWASEVSMKHRMLSSPSHEVMNIGSCAISVEMSEVDCCLGETEEVIAPELHGQYLWRSTSSSVSGNIHRAAQPYVPPMSVRRDAQSHAVRNDALCCLRRSVAASAGESVCMASHPASSAYGVDREKAAYQ